MPPELLVSLLSTVVVSVMASGGLWAFLDKRHQRRDDRTQLLIGLAHEQIKTMCQGYIDSGYITPDEYKNLHRYFATPYLNLGGNGFVKHILEEVDELPVRIHQRERVRNDQSSL